MADGGGLLKTGMVGALWALLAEVSSVNLIGGKSIAIALSNL